MKRKPVWGLLAALIAVVAGHPAAAFLMMPHATMPNPPLSRNDARDIAAFIMTMKN
ncbi:hypothetical protein [Rhodopseudomonas sp. P2A-2r]|uniref:hypothetical protein n=1 Tax=unclassified Rhodopseudomonas TaxID=2638247 RepID=UPI0022345732|nr:hypothetical protein [Rhodopseudomonas sp. P2A-2r]UZE49413.1 hypothetical protein ONR75_00665 [Rhodopseudomonas sp. P2A-2r]